MGSLAKTLTLRTAQGFGVIAITAGFFVNTLTATGRRGDGYQDGLRGGTQPAIDLEMLVGIAIWASVFVVVLSLAMEFALLRIDPRVRTARQI